MRAVLREEESVPATRTRTWARPRSTCSRTRARTTTTRATASDELRDTGWVTDNAAAGRCGADARHLHRRLLTEDGVARARPLTLTLTLTSPFTRTLNPTPNPEPQPSTQPQPLTLTQARPACSTCSCTWPTRGGARPVSRNYYVAGCEPRLRRLNHVFLAEAFLPRIRWLNFPLRAVPLSACGQGTASAISSGRK